MTQLSKLKSELELYAQEKNLTELQVVEKLNAYYFNKKVNDNLLYFFKNPNYYNRFTELGDSCYQTLSVSGGVPPLSASP